ncbi:MAG: amylo-alpha-1,6-glucosidase [Planctomycetota bacterium]
MNTNNSTADIFQQGYSKSLDLLRACSTPHGFFASAQSIHNYQRVWSRDSIIMGLAALLSGDPELVQTFRNSLITLANNQGPHGEIPSNVDPYTGRVSYGGMAGRVDADLLFVIGCGEYWKETGDDGFIDRMFPVIEKVIFLLGCWEFNNRGLLYVPQTGDWADEYLQHGYVLYDQVLYLQVKKTLRRIYEYIYQSEDHSLLDSINRLKHLIQANYWIEEDHRIPDEVYHEILYKKGMRAACECEDRYWMSYFSPHGYGYRFDSLANVLVSLLRVSDQERREQVDQYIENVIGDKHCKLLPAFYPVITPVDESDWQHLRMTFSYSFKNKPHEYHNGGLWPMISGFYVADLCRRNKTQQATRYLQGIHEANASEMDGVPWSFPEFLHGQTYQAGGTKWQGWSAAAALIGHHALEGKPVFRIDEQ